MKKRHAVVLAIAIVIFVILITRGRRAPKHYKVETPRWRRELTNLAIDILVRAVRSFLANKERCA